MPVKTEIKQTPLDRYITDFLEYSEIEKNQSLLTVRNYDHYLRRFSTWGKTHSITAPEDITLDGVRAFRLFINRLEKADGHPLKLATQQHHVIALRAFLKYLIKRDVKTLAPEKIELGKTPSREIQILTNEEIERLLQAIQEEPDELLRLRDRAILLTLFSSGVRISELASLKTKQINFKRGEFTVRGKGDKIRLCFLSTDAIIALEAYEKKRTDSNPALFVAHSKIGNDVTKQIEAHGETNKYYRKAPGLAVRSVQRLVKKYALIAGIMHKVSPHIFRHAFATDLLQNGADIRSVQSLLGHASITTTQIYTHITNEGLRDVHRKFHNKK